jgi:hypothetical protein
LQAPTGLPLTNDTSENSIAFPLSVLGEKAR